MRILPRAAPLIAAMLASCASPTPPPLAPAPFAPSAMPTSDAPGAQDVALAQNAIMAALARTLGGAPVAYRHDKAGIGVSLTTIPDAVLFDFGIGTPRADAGPALDAMASAMAQAPAGSVLTVAGDTDAVGSDDYNQALSEERAGNVVAALVRRGIDPARLAAIGFGRSRPIASNATDEGRARNRRAELALSSSFAANAAALEAGEPFASEPELGVPDATAPAVAAQDGANLARHPARTSIHRNHPETVRPRGLGPAISY